MAISVKKFSFFRKILKKIQILSFSVKKFNFSSFFLSTIKKSLNPKILTEFIFFK